MEPALPPVPLPARAPAPLSPQFTAAAADIRPIRPAAVDGNRSGKCGRPADTGARPREGVCMTRWRVRSLGLVATIVTAAGLLAAGPQRLEVRTAS